MSIQISGEQYVSEAAASASFNSEAIPVPSYHFALQSKWVGTIGGSVKIQATVNGLTWSDVPNTTKTILNTGSEIWDVSTSCPYVRFAFTITSGSAAFGAWITSKEDK